MAAATAASPFYRVFTAVALDDKIKARLVEMQQQLRTTKADVAWVHPENLHLSMVFLGDMPAHTLETLCRLIRETACGIKPFMMTVDGIGAFGAPHAPRVVWAGVPVSPALGLIHHSLSVAFASHGWQIDPCAYRPHITLGRIRSGRERVALAGMIETLGAVSMGAMSVAKLTLFRSVLKSDRAYYTALYEAPFIA